MSNVLDHEQQQQILALARLGWTVSRIATATGVRRETVTRYVRAAGLAVRGRGRPGEAPAKAAISGGVSTVDSIGRCNSSLTRRSCNGCFDTTAV